MLMFVLLYLGTFFNKVLLQKVCVQLIRTYSKIIWRCTLVITTWCNTIVITFGDVPPKSEVALLGDVLPRELLVTINSIGE